MEMRFEGIIEIGQGGFSAGVFSRLGNATHRNVGCGVWGVLVIAEIFLLGLRVGRKNFESVGEGVAYVEN
jgi:hypothetical protein